MRDRVNISVILIESCCYLMYTPNRTKYADYHIMSKLKFKRLKSQSMPRNYYINKLSISNDVIRYGKYVNHRNERYLKQLRFT